MIVITNAEADPTPLAEVPSELIVPSTNTTVWGESDDLKKDMAHWTVPPLMDRYVRRSEIDQNPTLYDIPVPTPEQIAAHRRELEARAVGQTALKAA